MLPSNLTLSSNNHATQPITICNDDCLRDVFQKIISTHKSIAAAKGEDPTMHCEICSKLH